MTLNGRTLPQGDGKNNLFFQNENKQILWDLLSASRYFDGLEKEDFNQTLQAFEETMTEVHHTNRNHDIIGLNKLFLLKFKDRISQQHNGHQDNVNQSSNHQIMTKSSNTMKSQYTGDIERQTKEKKNEMLNMLHPKTPAAIDFTSQEPYNLELRHTTSSSNYQSSPATSSSPPRLEFVDEITINDALENKIKAREKELSAYYANRPSNEGPKTHDHDAPNKKSKTLSLLENTVSDNVHSRFEDFTESSNAPNTKRLIIENPIPNDILSETITHIKSKTNELNRNKDERIVRFKHDVEVDKNDEEEKHNHESDDHQQKLMIADDKQKNIVAHLDAIIQQQERTNELLQKEIDIMRQLVNKID